MGEQLKLAWRNILRHKRRSLLTGLAMLVSGFLLTFGLAFGDGMQRQMMAGSIATSTGHLLVTAHNDEKTDAFEESYSQTCDWKQVIKDPAPVEKLLAGVPGVTRVSRRVRIAGRISNGERLEPGFATGIHPSKEREELLRVMPPDQGEFLEDDDPTGIYISHTTADLFKVTVGDSLILVSQTADGGINALDFVVKGIFKKGAPWTEYASFITLGSAQQLAMLGEGVTSLKVMLRDPGLAKARAAALRPTLRARFNADVKDWDEAGSFLKDAAQISKVTLMVVYVALFIVVAATVMNTMLMAVHERTREIGMLRAMGTSRRQVVALFLLEALVLALISAGAGVAAGGGLAAWLARVGIPAASPSMSYSFGGPRGYPYLTWGTVAFSYGLVVVLGVVASVYPALTAARLKPVEALNYL